jgi:hypothetical protein
VSPTPLQNPPLVGFAESCAIADHGLWVEFIFSGRAQEAPATVVARFVIPLDDIVLTFWPQSRDFFVSTLEMAQRASFDLPQIGVPEANQPYGGAAVLVNLIGISRAGLDCLWEAYYISSRSLHTAQTRGIPAEPLPIAAVQLMTPLMVSVLQRVNDLMPEFSERLARYSVEKNP